MKGTSVWLLRLNPIVHADVKHVVLEVLVHQDLADHFISHVLKSSDSCSIVFLTNSARTRQDLQCRHTHKHLSWLCTHSHQVRTPDCHLGKIVPFQINTISTINTNHYEFRDVQGVITALFCYRFHQHQLLIVLLVDSCNSSSCSCNTPT